MQPHCAMCAGYLALTGGIVVQEGQALLRRVPEVDVVMGPQHANQITSLLDQATDGQVCIACSNPWVSQYLLVGC